MVCSSLVSEAARYEVVFAGDLATAAAGDDNENLFVFCCHVTSSPGQYNVEAWG